MVVITVWYAEPPCSEVLQSLQGISNLLVITPVTSRTTIKKVGSFTMMPRSLRQIIEEKCGLNMMDYHFPSIWTLKPTQGYWSQMFSQQSLYIQSRLRLISKQSDWWKKTGNPSGEAQRHEETDCTWEAATATSEERQTPESGVGRTDNHTDEEEIEFTLHYKKWNHKSTSRKSGWICLQPGRGGNIPNNYDSEKKQESTKVNTSDYIETCKKCLFRVKTGDIRNMSQISWYLKYITNAKLNS